MSMVERKEFVQDTLALGAAGIALGLTAAMPAWAQGQADDAHEAAATADAAEAQAEDDDADDRAADSDEAAQVGQLPPAEPDPDSDFDVDLNVNMDTIDDYLGIPGVAYRDMRLLKDPADYSAIGGDSVLSFAIAGFKVVPYPYVGTLQELPVSGAYEGEHLFAVEWDEAGEIVSATPCYEQSLLILQDLFPRHRKQIRIAVRMAAEPCIGAVNIVVCHEHMRMRGICDPGGGGEMHCLVFAR